jgi:MFS family permease
VTGAATREPDRPTALSRVRLLAPLRNRDFRLLWTGVTLSLLGDGVLLVALAWQAYQLSDRPGAMAGVGVALTLPQVLLVLVAGVVSDRVDRRLLMLTADAVRAGVLGVVGLLAATAHLELWHLLAGITVYGTAAAFFLPAFDALVPEVVDEELLVEANALDQFVRPAALWLLGPALGGVLVAAHGAGPAFLLDALTFVVSATCLTLMRVGRSSSDDSDLPRDAVTVRGTVQELREGLQYVARAPWLWATFVAATFTYLLFLGPTEVLLPYLVKHDLHGDAADLGLILAAGGVSALVTAFVVGQTGIPRRVMTFTYVAWAVATLGVAGYGLAQTRGQAMAAAALIAGCEAAGAVAWTTTKQRFIPSGLLGRVSSFDWFISLALVPLSYALSAPAAAHWGARATLVGAGVVGALLTAGFLFVPGVRDPDGWSTGSGDADEDADGSSPAVRAEAAA